MGLASSLATGMLPITVISRWFRRDLGKASGIFYMGMGLGGVATPIVAKIVDKLGWQTTLLYASIGYLLLGISLSFVFRNRPEDYGLLPDGKTAVPATGSRPTQKYNFSTRFREALKMRAFWHINVVTFCQNSMMGILNLYIMPYLAVLGYNRATASMAVMLFTLASLVGRLPLGMLADKFKKNYLVAITVGMMGAGLFIFSLIHGSSPFWLILLFAIIYGLGMGGVMVLRPPILAEYFGVGKFGSIFGLTSIVITVAGVVATPTAGWIYDTFHDYRRIWLILVSLAVLSVISMLTIPAAKKRTEEVTNQATSPKNK